MIPIEDAVTVAYVGVVHAVSELKDLYWQTSDDTWAEIKEALEDLNRALEVMQPHVRRASV